MKISRRNFLKTSALAASGIALSAAGFSTPSSPSLQGAPYLKNPKVAGRVICIGFDGMDPVLLRRYVAEGLMPNFQKLIEKGHFSELGTTMPPQSPVAWSSFISGTNPGGHGIYDFIHRDADEFAPYMSTTRSFGSSSSIKLGDWALPLGSGKVELLRKGPVLWDVLEKHNVPASVFQIPANFPVTPGNARQISGMGTPDLLGSYGTCTYFTNKPIPGGSTMGGLRMVNVNPVNHVVRTRLEGPPNPFSSKGDSTAVDLTVHRDPRENVARITIDGQQVVLKQGEWSGWIPIRFKLLGQFAGVAGMVRLYMKELHPYFKLYVSPINIDPFDASLPISNPPEFASELAEELGRFYTQGFPADTKALSNGVLSDEEYFQQARIVLDENLRSFEYQLRNFHEGLFFFYFSTLDQNQHMLWRNMDPTHPLFEENAPDEVKTAVKYFYTSLDDVVRQALEKADSNTTIFILSDHGFAPFKREFHLNTWLLENGYMALKEPEKRLEGEFFKNVDWEKTRAFGLGINGLYINVRDREKFGNVLKSEAKLLKQELASKLAEVRDPLNNEAFITKAYDSQEIYRGNFKEMAPDLVLGFTSGYRTSDISVLGSFAKEVVSDRTDKWAGDHCIDPAVVPGVFMSNRDCSTDKKAIWDVAPTILKAFGIETPPEMEGRSQLKV